MQSLCGVAFPDAQHGWAVGVDDRKPDNGGLILATTDGGAHWQVQKAGTTNQLFDVAFTDATHGWAVGEEYARGGTILATTDGGAHWQVQRSGVANQLLGVAFPDTTHGWAVGDWGTIIATSSKGN